MKIALMLAAFVIGCFTTASMPQNSDQPEVIDRVVLLGALSSRDTTSDPVQMGVKTESFGKTADVVRIVTAKPPISSRGPAHDPGYTNAAGVNDNLP